MPRSETADLGVEAGLGEERDRHFKETEEAVHFYDAHVKTGNDVLDTIFNRKSFVAYKTGHPFFLQYPCRTYGHH